MTVELPLIPQLPAKTWQVHNPFDSQRLSRAGIHNAFAKLNFIVAKRFDQGPLVGGAAGIRCRNGFHRLDIKRLGLLEIELISMVISNGNENVGANFQQGFGLRFEKLPRGVPEL